MPVDTCAHALALTWCCYACVCVLQAHCTFVSMASTCIGTCQDACADYWFCPSVNVVVDSAGNMHHNMEMDYDVLDYYTPFFNLDSNYM